jgi:hypothetical protein
MSKIPGIPRSFLLMSAISITFLPLATEAFSEGIGARLADGKAWSMASADGQSGELTLIEGGKGKMKGGPIGMALNVKWREEGKLFCIKPGPLPERCMDMLSVTGGFDGYFDGKKFVSLRR